MLGYWDFKARTSTNQKMTHHSPSYSICCLLDIKKKLGHLSIFFKKKYEYALEGPLDLFFF